LILLVKNKIKGSQPSAAPTGGHVSGLAQGNQKKTRRFNGGFFIGW
jgi:hypothetical protein